MRGFLIFLFLFFALMGSLAFFGGLKVIFQVMSLKNNGVEIGAVVVGFDEDEATTAERLDPDNRQYNDYFTPVVQYTVNNKIITASSGSGSVEVNYSIDQLVIIRYDSTSPENFVIVGDEGSSIGSGIIAFVLGLVILIILILFFRKRKVIFEKIYSVNQNSN